MIKINCSKNNNNNKNKEIKKKRVTGTNWIIGLAQMGSRKVQQGPMHVISHKRQQTLH